MLSLEKWEEVLHDAAILLKKYLVCKKLVDGE